MDTLRKKCLSVLSWNRNSLLLSQLAENFYVDVGDFVLFACTQAYHKAAQLKEEEQNINLTLHPDIPQDCLT